MTDLSGQLGLRKQSPVVPISLKEFAAQGLEVFIKRDDLLHPTYGGNKWRKLKYNLQAYQDGAYREIWTYGGIHSNHIYATAGICQQLSIPCHGIIRDSRQNEVLTPTLEFALDMGMQLHYVSRTAYRDKKTVFHDLSSNLAEGFYLIPEGGSNALALKGVGEIVNEVVDQLQGPMDYWVCPAGSGGTAAGLLSQLDADTKLLVFPSLKGNWMEKAILDLLTGTKVESDLQVINEYHFGGYAKHTEALIAFIIDWYERTGIALDPIYNAKTIFGFLDLVQKGYFRPGSRIVILHTGGLQGIPGFNKRNALQLPTR